MISADERRILYPALLSTLVFFVFTVSTHYPFLVDDYVFLWRSKLPGYSIRDFIYLLPQRPLATLINYVTFGLGILEHTKVPFLIYYFLHSVGVLLIFYRLERLLFPKTGEAARPDRELMLVGALICLYPGWYEITLLALDLPYGLGVIFLGLALWREKPLSRAILYFLSFCCLEAYVFPALALAAFEFWATRKKALALFLPILAAGLCYSALQKGIVAGFSIPPHYGIGFDLGNALNMAGMYLRMLAFHSFYKIDWVATALDLTAMTVAAIAVIRRDRSWGPRIGILFLLPCIGAAHALVLIGYYAPRAIHGAMVLRTVSAGIVLLAFLRLYRKQPDAYKWAPALGVLLAFLVHHGLILSNRSFNERIISAKEVEVENLLRTCTSPCRVSLRGIEDQLRWDWIMRPTFHVPFVLWIKERMHVEKELLVD